MLEYIAYKKFKKNKDVKKAERARQEAKDEAARAASRPRSPAGSIKSPVLTDDDELFLERLTSGNGYTDEAGKRPPLPPRTDTLSLSWNSDTDNSSNTESMANGGGRDRGKGRAGERKRGSDDDDKKTIRRFFSVRRPASRRSNKGGLAPASIVITPSEEAREEDDIGRVLDDLNLSARNNKTFSLSKDSAKLVADFTVVLKDLVNGVPTATSDLKHLLDDHDGTLARNYEKLPKSMKKLVTSLPTKLTGTVAPELLAVAAESQGLKGEEAPQGGLKDQAMNLLVPKNMSELVTKPSAIIGMLKAIMNFLKLRWPAFIGTNVIWSVAVFLLLSVLWYCHKRGREVRLERERAASEDVGHRVEELSVEELSDADSAVSPFTRPPTLEHSLRAGSPKRIKSSASSSGRR